MRRAGAPISEARAAKRFPLLAPSLEGLRRFAHLISVEYFGDLLAVMVQVAAAPGLPARMRLHVLLTASDILKCAPVSLVSVRVAIAYAAA